MSLLAEPRELSVAVPGGRLHAELIPAADPSALWLTFGNSLLTDLSIWDAQAATFAGRYGILRYDQHGHGRSDAPAGSVDFHRLGGDLLAVLDAAGIGECVYVGLSMGVPTALAASAAAPERFRALVLVDGQPRTAPGGGTVWAGRIAEARADFGAFTDAAAARWLTADASPQAHARLVATMRATPFAGFEACATALGDFDLSAGLARIGCPVLCVAGAEDGAMPGTMARALAAVIPGARIEVIAGAGHVPCFERPDRFDAVLADFLAEL